MGDGYLFRSYTFVYFSKSSILLARCSRTTGNCTIQDTKIEFYYTCLQLKAEMLTRSSAIAEIARVGGRYAVEDHSRSLMLVTKARIRLPISE